MIGANAVLLGADRDVGIQRQQQSNCIALASKRSAHEWRCAVNAIDAVDIGAETTALR